LYGSSFGYPPVMYPDISDEVTGEVFCTRGMTATRPPAGRNRYFLGGLPPVEILLQLLLFAAVLQ
jgi:hypothetical protein